MNGTKRFPEHAELLKFLRAVTHYTPKRVTELLEQVAEGAQSAIDAALVLAAEHPDMRRFVESYVGSLNRGMTRSLLAK